MGRWTDFIKEPCCPSPAPTPYPPISISPPYRLLATPHKQVHKWLQDTGVALAHVKILLTLIS